MVKIVEAPGDTVVEKEVMVEVERDNLPLLIVGNLNAFTGSIAEFGPPPRNSVRHDKPRYRACPHVERTVIHRPDAAKILDHIPHMEK